MQRIIVSVAGVLLLSVVQPLFAGLGTAGTVLPDPRHSHFNPALSALPRGTITGPGGRIPLGAIGLVARSVGAELEAFDLAPFVEQFTRPFHFVANPTESPDTVRIVIDATGMRIDGYRPVDASGFDATHRSYPGTPLFGRPVVRYHRRSGRWDAGVGLYLGAGAIGFVPNDELRATIETGAVKPDSVYGLSAVASGETGIYASATYLVAVDDLPFALDVAARVVAAYSAAGGSAEVDVETTTDSAGFPAESSVDGAFALYRPGTGGGVRVRGDLGAVARTGGWTLGVGVLNALGYAVTRTNVVALGDDFDAAEPRLDSFSAYFPQLVLHGAYTRSVLGVATVIVAGSATYTESFGVSGTVGVERGPVFFRWGIGVDDDVTAAFSVGAWFGRWALEAGVQSFPTPFGLGRSVGYGLAVHGGPW
ncbi:MAG: hypothetical protein EA426_16515 [Spirochaetaceae bacterium]|nr:MAG: hypothetical protein EA426_16515 [Spirochaetaceae bacterium]